MITTALAAFIGLFCTLSFGSLSDFKIFGKNVFDLLDFLTSNVGMPLSEIGFSVAAAWIAWKVTAKQLTSAGPLAALGNSYRDRYSVAASDCYRGTDRSSLTTAY